MKADPSTEGPPRARSELHGADYRRDIDGLRALAVLAVVIFHYFPKLLPGGYVGVDVFFVISGFLISGILFRQIRAGEFSFADFYSRRVRRIFPALGVVLIFTWVGGWLFLLPDEFKQLGKHLSAAIGFYSNIQLRREAGYFDGAADLKPLLHLWSLGIEEQYYLFWPIALFLVWRRRLGGWGLMIPLWLGSFGLNLLWVRAHPIDAFYSPQSRFWELLVGSLAAYRQIGNRADSPARARLQSALGLLMLLLAIALLKQDSLFPGWWAILPCVGTALLLSAGPRTWIAQKIFAQPSLVFVGLISYPLYLWHWPLLAYLRIAGGEEPAVELKFATLLTAFILAWLTFRLIEIPVRFSRRPAGQTALIWLALMLAALPVAIATSHGQINARFANAFTLDALAAKEDWNYPGYGMDADEKLRTNVLRGSSPQTVLFMGDSHAEQYWPRIQFLYRSGRLPALTAEFATYDGCLPIPDNRGQRGWDGVNCDTVFRVALRMGLRATTKRVVFAGRWEALLDHPDWQGELNDLEIKINELRRAGKECIVILPNPTGHEYDDHSFIKPRYRVPKTFAMPPLDRKAFELRTAAVTRRLRELAAKTGSKIIDPVESLCDLASCPTVYEGKPIYKDDNHLRASYAEAHASFVDSTVLE